MPNTIAANVIRPEFGPLFYYRVRAQLQNQLNGAPLPGLTVLLFNLEAVVEGQPQRIGYDVTDAHGLFTIVSFGPPERVGMEHAIRLQIRDRDQRQIAQVDLRVKNDQKPVLVVPVAVPVQAPPPSTAIRDLANQVQLAVPQPLLDYLDRRQVHTLDDLRKIGGLSDQSDLPVPHDAVSVRTLDAHVSLNALSPDIQGNQRLFTKGFDSVARIARTSRASFVQAVSADVGDFKAGQMQAAAVGHMSFLQNIDAGLRATLANGGRIPIKIADPITLYPPKCGCADCDAAVSPLAYLADLLDYAIRHLMITVAPNPPQPITLDFLTTNFYQPFGDLPAACEEVDRPERQVRLCVEAVRRFLAAHPPAAASQQTLDAAEKAYRLNAYTRLLSAFGTSFADIRLARTAADPARQALADRLGIDLGSARPDHLDGLFLDPRAAAGGAMEITEPTLERVFGLVDTRRDPLSDGTKLGDARNQITRWNFSGVTWNRNTDADGFLFLRVAQVIGGYDVGVFRDPARAPETRVAHGSAQTPAASVDLVEDNNSGLSGRVLLNYQADSANISVSIVPALLSWRLAHLRTIWRQQDWPVDRYQDAFVPAEAREPFIDPDVISPDDFRTPFAETDHDRGAFDVWLRRRFWVDARITALRAMRQADGVPDLAAMIQSMYLAINYGDAQKAAWANTTQPADLEPLLRRLAQGQDVDATRRRIRTDLNMSVDGFQRLMALRQKDRDATADPRNAKPSLAEWREVYAILAQAWKAAFFPEWRAEERPLLFGPGAFWPALREPQQGDWPPPALMQSPLIDPEMLSLADLATTKSGGAATRLWEGRRAALDQIQADIRSAREARGFDAMVSQAVGEPDPGGPLPRTLDQLIADLNSADAARVAGATTIINTRLFLTLPGFNRLVQIRARSAAGQPVTNDDWAAAYALLTTARKRKQLEAGWRADETQLPLIDPVDVKLSDLAEATAGARALALWRTRGTALGQIRQDLQTARENRGFNAMVRHALGDPNPDDPLPNNLDLDALNADLTSGDTGRAGQAAVQITGRLFMTIEAFGRLMAVKTRNDDPIALRQPTAAEWAEAYTILTSAQKEKRLYGTWVQEEQDAVTGVKYWTALKAELPLWRGDPERRAAWRQALELRSQSPLIDPDLIGPGDLRDPTSGAVFNRWLARGNSITQWLNEFRNVLPAASDLQRLDQILVQGLFDDASVSITRARVQAIREAKGLDLLLRQLLGDPLPDLAALAAGLAANSVDARVQIAATLYLTIEGFQRLMAIAPLMLQADRSRPLNGATSITT